MESVRAEIGSGVHQHQLIVGPRGSGKTHVLTLAADRLESAAELGQQVLALPLAEEEVVGHPADLFIKILERLEGRLADRDAVEGRVRALAECRGVLDRLRLERDDDQALALAAGSLEEIARILDFLLVPLVENLDSILFAGYARKQAVRTHWALRKILTESKGLMLLASAPSFFGDVTDEGAPFYGFFRTHKLEELSSEETLDLIRRRIEVELRGGRTDGATERRLRSLLANFDRRSAGLRGLLVVTGGLPRFAHLLFDLLVETDVESSVGMLERFLDTQTPYFQSRLDPRIVPQAELEILETLATADGPLLLAEITSAVRGAVPGNVSNYLKRLRQRGLVRQRGRRQEVRYDLTEPLFRVWRRFRLGRSERQRIESLAELIAAVFLPSELAAERRDLERLPRDSWRRQAVDQALIECPAEELAEVRAYAIDDPEQDHEEFRRREEELERHRRRGLEEVSHASEQRRADHTLTSISDETFQQFVELAREAEKDGVRTGLIRFCIVALADPPMLLEWLPRFEVELPTPRRELLQPIRLVAEILDGRQDRELPAEPAEIRRAVQELLAKSEERGSIKVSQADLAGEMIQALIEQPTSEALDALWTLRVGLEQQEAQNVKAIVSVAETMAACGQRAEDWVRQAVHQADPATEPIHALAYLLTRLDNGAALWFELKDIFFSKIPERHERSIATCLETFHDDAHIDWLIARVNRKNDFLGVAARSALFLLRPGRPPDPVADKLWESPSFMAPNGWLLPHLNAASIEAVNLIVERIMRSENPLRIARWLSGLAENRITPEAISHLLDATTKVATCELAQPSKANREPMLGPCTFLSGVRSPLLIEQFEIRAGTQLDYALARWLCMRGPNNSWWHRPVEEIVIRTLKRIGGEGLTRVANHYLRDGRTWPALLEAIELAVMRPDQETADLLFEVAMRDEVESREGNASHPVAQVEAVGALVTIGRLDLAFRGAMKWGLNLTKKVAPLFAEQYPTDDDLKPVIEAIDDTDDPSPGAVFALGLARRKGDAPRLHSLLEKAKKGSTFARACLFALDLIRDRSPATTEAFIENLDVSDNEYPSLLGLFKIHTREALVALKGRLGDINTDHISSNTPLIAVNLLMARDPDIRREVAEYLWTELDRERILFHFVTRGELDAFAELDRQDVHDWIDELAFEGYWMDFGVRLAAIRILARRDRDRAFEAARLLAGADFPSRENAPALLLEIDRGRALPLLRDWMEEEDSVSLLATAVEALHLAGELPALLDWLADESPRLREGVCLGAEVLPWTDRLARILRKRLYDDAWSVRVAANQALNRVWHAREIDRLVEEIISEPDTTRRWCLLDVALEGGHPGLAGPYREQPWVARLFEHLPLAMRLRIVDRLEKRRKKLRDDLKKRERLA